MDDRMSPTPLHDLARSARDALREQAEAIPHPPASADAIQAQARVSVNMKPSMLRRFLDGEPRRNAFEQAEVEAQRTGESVDTILRKHQGDYFHLRRRFEARAGGTRHFHYGALNVGGMGAPRYGRFCVIDGRRPTQPPFDPVWVAEDTLTGRRFRDRIGRLLWRKLAAWCAPSDAAGHLAIVKLASMSPTDGPLHDQICSDTDYIEALFLDPLDRQEVEEIRSESDDTLQERSLTAIFDAAPLSETLDLDLHAKIRDKAAALGIRWKEEAT